MTGVAQQPAGDVARTFEVGSPELMLLQAVRAQGPASQTAKQIVAKRAISQGNVSVRESGLVQTLAKFSWCKAGKFYEFTAEVTAIEIAQAGPDLFDAQKRF